MDGRRKKQPKLKIPYYPDDGEKEPYTVHTLEEKTVAEYTGYTFSQLETLSVFEFWLYLRDAVVFNCLRTEEGREHLKKCKRIEQTNPDRKTLRKKYGK